MAEPGPLTAAVAPVAPAGIVVRGLDPQRDGPGLRACMVELQDYERALEPDLPDGERIADAYLAHLADRCRAYDGRVFVAATPDDVAGFVCVLATAPADAPDDPTPYAYISPPPSL